MYVCVCKAITDKQIHQAINDGACSRRQLHQCTGVGSICGKCRNHVSEILDETLQSQPIMQAA